MKKLILILSVFVMAACSPCDVSMCKFAKGEDVKIKHKDSHNEATVTQVYCGCQYEISYYSTFDTRRHRDVEECEIQKLK